MILRSQLRMNKNIVLPFISCIMLMFTLLVLLHKATDELNTVRKELSRCKEQYESTFTQLQNAIDMKLRLEKSLEIEKSEGKQKLDKIQALLDQEKEDRLKEKNGANMKYDSMNDKLDSLQTENADLKDQIEKLNKRISDTEKETHEVNIKLKEAHDENERKNQMIHNLDVQLKTMGNASISLKKQIFSDDAGPVASESLKVAPVQSLIKDSSTPPINPAAVKQDEESPKQMMPPPDREQENSLQKQRPEVVNVGIQAGQIRPPPQHDGKAPLIRNDDDKESVPNQNNAEGFQQNGDKEHNNMFLRKPPNFDQPNKPASSASNNAAENPEMLRYQKLKEKKRVLPMHESKDDANDVYDNNLPEVEDDGDDPENRNKEMNQPDYKND